MRGIFAAGVLDEFIEADYQPFSSAYGVSAGATNLIGYLCHQYGRNRRIITGHACRREFIDIRRFIGGGHLCDVRWLWHQSRQDIPLDLDRYLSGTTRLWVTTTSVSTGQPLYHLIDEHSIDEVMTASCAIPLAYRSFPSVAGEPMTDGGLADSIPVQEAYRRGARDITVVLSRPLSYRKSPSMFPSFSNWIFRQHPVVADALRARVSSYNEALDFIAAPPAGCRIRVLAPPSSFPVSRLTRNPRRLMGGYNQGRRIARSYLAEQAV